MLILLKPDPCPPQFQPAVEQERIFNLGKDLTFKCINCGTENRLQDSVLADFSSQVEETVKARFESRAADLEAREEQIESNRRQLASKEAELAEAKATIDLAVQEKLEVERTRIAAEERQKAFAAAGAKVTTLESMLHETNEKLAAAEEKELQLLREKAALDEEKRKIELTVAQKMADEREEIRAKAQQEAEELLGAKVTEKEVLIESLKKQTEELRRRIEQGSQQLQGEAQEVDLFDTLSSAFKTDEITRITKGQHGADVIQQVNVVGGFGAGRILTESKRTKTWNADWIDKAKEDKRDAKADLVVIVTTALPRGVTAFDCIDGVWVTSVSCAISVVAALRWALIETSTARFALQKRDSPQEGVYAYLTGGEFRERVRAIVENVMLLEDQIRKERRFMERSWAEQAKQVERLTVAAAGMYGDLRGIIGSSLPQIDGLDVPMLEAGEPISDDSSDDKDADGIF